MERVLEVWCICDVCRQPVRLLDRDWHHEEPADHRVVLATDRLTVGS